MKNITKLFTGILVLFLVVGCSMKPSPTKQVEDLLSKYKSKDVSVLEQLEGVVNDAGTLTDEQKVKYRKLMERQYENISYKVKEEKIDGNSATVVVEIEVYDYGKAITDAEIYLTTNNSEFLDSETNTVDQNKFLDYKIGQMENMDTKIKYTVNFTLTKKDNNWVIDDLSDIDRLKVHGLYY